MQNIKKYFMTLALLLTAVTGAWAEEQSESFTTATNGQVTYTGEHFTITGDLADGDGLWIGNTGNGDKTVTIESKNGENITKIEAVLGYEQHWGDTKLATTSGKVTGTYELGQTITISSVNATTVTLSSPDSDFKLIQFKSWTIYYGDAPTPVTVTWNATTKTASIAAMPAGNVIVEPEYFAVAEFTDGGAPTGIADIKATTDDDIVKAGTVKNIGSSTTPQGTVMYYAVQSATAPTAPDYDATGWTDKVPTATDFAEGNVYVWYYVKGAEPASGTDRTDANTCSDSEITALGTTGYVTLLAAPKYNAEFAFDEGTPDAEKAKWGTNIPDGGVVKGTAVTVTYTGSKKVIGVKAEKKAAPAAVPEYYNKLTKINDSFYDQVNVLKQLGRGLQAYNSSLTAAQAYALATYQAAIDGRPVYVIMSSQDEGYEIHYAVSTDASATEHTADLYNLCSESNTVRMYYVAQ